VRPPRRVEGLHHGHDLADLFHRGLAALGDLLVGGAQVPVLVEVADDLGADAPDERVVAGVAQLLVQVVGQRRHRADHVLERQVLAVLLGDERALLVVVEDDGREIERQVVGLALGGRRRRRVAAERLRRRRRRHVGRGVLAVGLLRRLGLHLLEQRIFQELLLDDFLELEGAQLEQLDGLLQQRRHDDSLALPQ